MVININIMDKLPMYILQDILYFLDILSTKECKLVNKKLNSLISQGYFWKVKFTKPNPSSYFSLPYFKFPETLSIFDRIHCSYQDTESFADVCNFWRQISDPQKLKIVSIEASSEDHDQVAATILTYNQSFWSSKPNDSSETDEFLIIELKESSLIFAVNFYVYRAIYQGGTIYPPMFAKVYIGDTKDSFSYESEQYPIGLTENCNTILVLPELVKGKFIKLMLIGKQMRENGTEKWYTVLKYVEILGHNTITDPILERIKQGNFESKSANFSELSPFYLERLEKFGHIKTYFETVGVESNDISTYFHYIHFGVDKRVTGYSEILGNHLLEEGKNLDAKENFMRIGDVWGYCKACLRLENFNEIRDLVCETNPRLPSKSWVLSTAESFGGKELKDKVEFILDNAN